jgi:hypothetical protein
MKKLIITALLTIGMMANAQIRFVDKEYFTTSIAVDPNATIKDGLNLTGEIELVSYWKYIKVNCQFQPDLQGGYIDYAGSFGINLTSGYFDTWRAYTGVRFGHIRRETYGYPLAGFEGGIDFYVTNSTFLGLRATGDWRSDFLYSGAEPAMRYSGTIRAGFKF